MTDRDDSLHIMGAARFDRDTGRLLDADGGIIPLQPQTMAILSTLIARADEDVAKEVLASDMSGSTKVTDESLVQSVAEIRTALGDQSKTIIQTVPGIGYKLSTASPGRAGGERNALKFVGLAIALLPVLAFIAAAILNAFSG